MENGQQHGDHWGCVVGCVDQPHACSVESLSRSCFREFRFFRGPSGVGLSLGGCDANRELDVSMQPKNGP